MVASATHFEVPLSIGRNLSETTPLLQIVIQNASEIIVPHPLVPVKEGRKKKKVTTLTRKELKIRVAIKWEEW